MIRRTQWAAQAEIKAENVVKKKIQQWNKDNQGVVGASKLNREDLLKIAKAKAYHKCSLDDFPNYWITWLAMGPPAMNPSVVMLTNQIQKRSIDTIPVSAGEELFSRSKRRIQALKQATSVTSSSSNSRFETPKSSSSGASVTENDELLTHRREIALVIESIKDYYMIHGQDVDDDVIRRLKEVHREVQKKYLKYMETKLSIHPTETLILQEQP